MPSRRRTWWMRRLIVCVGAALAASVVPAAALDKGYSSYVTPFPPGERHKLFVFGDSIAFGLAASLTADLSAQNVDVINKAVNTPGLSRTDIEWEKAVEGLPLADDFQIAVVCIGLDDRGPIRLPKQRLDFGTPGWTQEYSRRIDGLLKALHTRKAAVYWVGLPIMRGEQSTSAAQVMNGLFLERSRLSNSKFIDSWDAFVDADGNYSDIGPDLTGNVRQLRMPDGVHLTQPGAQKLANIIEREILQDLTAARRERDVPLAGDEPEQQNVRDDSLPRSSTTKAGAAKSAKNRDVPADDGTVSLAATADAQPEIVTIVRPPISGAVLSQILAGRLAQQSDLGHTMPADLFGGFTALSSVATSADAKANLKQQLPLTESPFYRLLIRGDEMPGKPGRADDFSWPRQGAPAGVEAAPGGVETAPGGDG